MPHRFWPAIALVLLTATLCGCGGEPDGDATDETAQRPLQPLFYTERPDLSPEAAAVRERRLMRQLLESSHVSGTWGSLEAPERTERPATTTADELGRAMFSALVDHDEGLWDTLFVAPKAYAQMVRVEVEQARIFVDDIQGKSRSTWRSFEPGPPSEAPEGGLASVLEFERLALGEGRTLGGKLADDDEPVAQHWGNVLVLRLENTDVFFELVIPKILRVTDPRMGPQAASLALGAPVAMSPQLEVYLRAGLHLKPQLLEAREYPYPLAVGNFWRYQRRPAGQEAAADDLVEADQAARISAGETLLEVTAVDHFEPFRLVTLRRTYNDAQMTSIEQHWLVMARRIYRCSHTCRQHIEDLDWLLTYLARQTPIYRFPLRLDQGWASGGELSQEEAIFRVDSDWRDVHVRAGNFTNTVAIEGSGPLGAMDPYHRDRTQRRFFAHGRGLVRRVLGPSTPEDSAIIEELVESRIMAR